MKKTIRILATSLFLLTITGTTFSQDMRFGFRLGVTNNFVTYTVEEEGYDAKYEGSNVGFYAAGVANIQLSEHFALQPNLVVGLKGGGFGAIYGSITKINIVAIDVPINALYTSNGFFIGGGPNFSYGLSGKLKPNLEGEKVDIFDDSEEGAGDLALKRFDIGANLLVGYTLPNGLTFSAHFTPGLANIYAPDADNVKARTKTFGFSVGYLFGGKGK